MIYSHKVFRAALYFGLFYIGPDCVMYCDMLTGTVSLWILMCLSFVCLACIWVENILLEGWMVWPQEWWQWSRAAC